MQLQLETGDKVITAFHWRDFILVVTERGRLFRVSIKDGMDFKPEHVIAERL